MKYFGNSDRARFENYPKNADLGYGVKRDRTSAAHRRGALPDPVAARRALGHVRTGRWWKSRTPGTASPATTRPTSSPRCALSGPYNLPKGGDMKILAGLVALGF